MIYAINKRTKEHRLADRHRWAFGEYRLVNADPDGWISWDAQPGKESPLPKGAGCDIRHIDGYEVGFCPADREKWTGLDALPNCTVVAYRPILDAQGEPEAPEWDGESWPPPIGSVIESSATWKDGTPAEVLAVRHGHVIGCHVETGVAGWLEREYCRPLRTPAQRAEEEAVEAIENIVSVCLDDRDAAETLYRAGYRKVEDEK